MQHLLQGISTHVIYLLRLIPPGSDTNTGTTQTLLDLGKRVINAWTNWLNNVSAEVNQQSGMFPHSIVEGWAFNLDTLANIPAYTPSSGGFGWSCPQPTSEPSNALVDSFRDAMRPLRDRFTNELGWLIGRHPTTPFSNASAPSWGNVQAASQTNHNEDEEL
jgi:hypothetical protein